MPFEGNILIDQKRLKDLSGADLARLIAYIPQRSSIYHSISVMDYILLGRFPYLNWLGQFQEEDIEHALAALKKLELEHLKEKDIRKISGGELRKVLFCRGLVQQASVYLFDEPTQDLDPMQRCFFFEWVEELNGEGKQVWIASHDIQAITSQGQQHILALKDGEIWFSGTVPDLPSNWLEELYS